MNTNATPTTQPDLIVALEIPTPAKRVKERLDYQPITGNPVYYATPCVVVLADGRRFASKITAKKRKDLGKAAESLARWIAEGACRARFLAGKFVCHYILLPIGG